MAETQRETKVTSITKAAFDDPGISDFRKETRSFAVIARGVTADDTEEICAALMFDYLAGKMDSTQVAGLLACVDRTLKREDQLIERQGLILQADLRRQTAVRLEERRARIEAERPSTARAPAEGIGGVESL
jgi:hypothetical protein